MKTRLNGLEMNWERHGPESETPVVLIHGFPFGAAMWDPQVQALGREFPLVTYDLRGFGASEAPAEPFHFEVFVDDLAALLDHLGARKAILCGLSMGGYVGLRFTERHPDRVAGLALCATRSDADTDAMRIRRAAQARTVRLEG
ncbi:MAG TPA: alpha/beta fold hydrolase, partial [Bdellovibrionota bacterium]|nr:alpha/beta fold hydrolase [Bdellovibrionota bacterium]